MRILFLILFLAVPAASFSKPVTYQCLLKGSGWIAEQIVFEVDDAKDTVRVSDGIMLHFERVRSKPAIISENSEKKLVFKWAVQTKTGGKTAKMDYRVALFKGTNKALVRAHPHGFIDNLTSRGRCQQVNLKIPAG